MTRPLVVASCILRAQAFGKTRCSRRGRVYTGPQDESAARGIASHAVDLRRFRHRLVSMIGLRRRRLRSKWYIVSGACADHDAATVIVASTL